MIAKISYETIHVKRTFTFCAHCKPPAVGSTVWQSSCEIGDYCATGHHFSPKTQWERDARQIIELQVEKDKEKSIVSDQPNQSITGGHYHYDAYTVTG